MVWKSDLILLITYFLGGFSDRDYWWMFWLTLGGNWRSKQNLHYMLLTIS